MKEKDNVEYFKRELQSYTYYQKKIKECDEKLECIKNKMLGLSSPGIKEPILENVGNPYHDNKIELMEEEQMIVEEKSMWINRMLYVEKILVKMPDCKEKEIMIKVFKNKELQYKVAFDENMDRKTMRRKINQFISKFL